MIDINFIRQNPQKGKGISTLVGIIIIVAVVAVGFGGVFAYQYWWLPKEGMKSSEKSNYTIRDVDFCQVFENAACGSCHGMGCPGPGNPEYPAYSACLQKYSIDTGKSFEYDMTQKYPSSWWDFISVKTGDACFGSSGLGDYGGTITSLKYADLDDDGVEEAIVFRDGGGNGGNTLLSIYKLISTSKITNLKIADSSGVFPPYKPQWNDDYRIVNNKLVETYPLTNSCHACPVDGWGVISFGWSKKYNEFVVDKKISVDGEWDNNKINIAIQELTGGDNLQKSGICTQEAKICPDGSAVGRVGPNCEFAPCPDETANWKIFSENSQASITIEVNVELNCTNVDQPTTLAEYSEIYKALSGEFNLNNSCDYFVFIHRIVDNFAIARDGYNNGPGGGSDIIQKGIGGWTLAATTQDQWPCDKLLSSGISPTTFRYLTQGLGGADGSICVDYSGDGNEKKYEELYNQK